MPGVMNAQKRVRPPTEDEVLAARKELAAARQQQLDLRRCADEDAARAKAVADKEFAKTVKKWRKKRVPWQDISEATGLVRQVLSDMLRNL